MLSVHHLHKEFATVVAVDDVSFSVQRGQIYGLIGPNGAGKSTTIRMIMGILQPDTGEVLFEGAPATEKTKNKIGYLPEERGLYRKNKLINAIAYFGSLKGLSIRDARKRAMPLLSRFQLESYANRKIEELSKGNQQKVQFIISVLHDPPLIVLDEIFSGLDPINQDLMTDILLSLKKENRAIVFSTHQMEHAERLCDDLCLINRGKIVLHGSPASIKKVYGKNTISIEYDGEGLEKDALPGVRRMHNFISSAELELEPGVRTNQVLAELMQRVEVRRFERVEPSLHSIFVDVVGLSDLEGTEAVAPATAQIPMASRDKRVRKALRSFLLIFFGSAIFFVMQMNTRKPFWAIPVATLLISLVYLVRFFQIKNKVRRELEFRRREVRENGK